MNLSALEKQLIEHEGIRHTIYTDSVGVPTIGVGHNLKVPLTEEAVMFILADDISAVLKDLDSKLPWWSTLDEIRQLVIADMCFNLGINGLLKFPKMLAATQARDYEQAAIEMEDSRWYEQVGRRAERLCEMMRTGKEVPYA